MEKIPSAHPSILCSSLMLLQQKQALLFFKTWLPSKWDHFHFACMLCRHRYLCTRTCRLDFPAKERKGIFASTRNVIFHCCRFSPQFCFLHDSSSAKLWNIYEGFQDGAPFQDLPLWLRIRAFSLVLNNSCRESICLVRFFCLLSNVGNG